MKLEDHCRESILLFGKSFEEVHVWLDQFAGSKECGMRHRRKRHHMKGMMEARRLFGDLAAEAARRHIISDLKMEGWTEGDRFPMDEEDYIRMGLF
jgi:hypothetical protein